MARKKVLVTGGAGFIGGNFVQYMVNKYPDYDIYNVDLLTYAGDLTKHKEIEKKDNYHFIKADIADRDAITALFEKEQFDYVTHFAAESHVDRSIIDPEIFVVTNVFGTQVLLDGASKASSDMLVRAYHETFGLPINITRCSNNYGPYHFPEKLIPLTISRVLNDQKIPVYGDGKNIRDWLHVLDHCVAIDLVLHEGVDGDVYNVGGHNERTNLEVVKTIIRTLGKSEDLIEFVTDRLGHDKRYAIDPTKLEALGWKPTYTFESGIAQTIQWYLDNKEWWEQIISGEYQNYFEKQYSF
ncbi:dTDP-glucose 4,6-dehydratase [Bacillus circulans]|uniref:dTDP-glucose 4,6-dehydratase n=1 Tax=Niallia circulans TaxID=1397 RepID=UPI00155FE8EF|nr:dTDP-glucose 4,6-dehydratase [Niallia circulans]NRG29500.1 dTDP-glucose 4,6-dehydratase [Niallia circulans]